MSTVCHKQLSLGSLFGKQIVADFAGGRITSDAGGVLLRAIDHRYGLSEAVAESLRDPRHPSWVIHELKSLVKQRIFSIALGYEDSNDAAALRSDPALKTIAGSLPETSVDLASAPTLCRFENRTTRRELRRLAEGLFSLYVKTHPGPREVIVIDIDATDDPTHGQQQLSFFHGYYREHMYHPLLVFDGISGFPMACVLRAGNTHASHGAKAVLTRVIKKLKQAYPRAQIVVRADAGFALPALYRLCERQRIFYAIGLITNDRLKATAADLLQKAEAGYRRSGEKQRLFTTFTYRAESWSRHRRVVAKCEYLDKGPNQRFVVTNIHLPPRRLYDEIYVLRGETENRIKELKLDLRADRLSCHRFLTNQLRLFLHTFAYCLFWLLRRQLQGTELACAQAGTLRLKLLKIGARIRESSRRVWIHMASGYPYKALFFQVLHSIREAPS